MGRKERRKQERLDAILTQTNRIPSPVRLPSDNQTLIFSFKHLDSSNPKFSLEDCDAAFYCALVTKIQEYSSWTVERFTDQNNNDRRHVINFSETTEPAGFSFLHNEQFEFTESWQFCLDALQVWRVHGFIIYDTFFIVWFDPKHRLYGNSAD